MFYWIYGVDIDVVYWVLGVLFTSTMLFLWYKSMVHTYEKRVSKGLTIYFNIHTIIPSQKFLLKLLSTLSIVSIIVISIIFFVNKDKVYGYKIADLNSINYDELLEVIKQEFQPDDGQILYNPYGYGTLNANYSDEFDLTRFRMLLFVIKDDQVYDLEIYSKSKSIIIHERDNNHDYLKRHLFPVNDLFKAINQSEDVFSDYIELNEGDFIAVMYDKNLNYHDHYYQNEKKVFIDQDGNTTIMSDDDLRNNQKFLFHFYIRKFEKVPEDESGLNHKIGEGMHFFIEPNKKD